MDILIISEFCEDFSITDNDRFLYLANMLSKDNDVELITSKFRHTSKSFRDQPMAEWPFRITFIDEPGYPKNVCLRRFRSHFCWGRNVERYLKARKKPDVIYCAVPSLTEPALTARYCNNNGIRYIIDVQDLWPEAFKMVVNIPIISDIAFFPFTIIANYIYKSADAICAVSDTYANRALKKNNKCSSGTTVFLGTNLDVFDGYAAERPILEKPEDEIWLAYCGTLGASYDITCALDALAIIDDPSLKFIVMGDGPRKEEFEEYAKEKNVNAIFTGRLKYSEMCSLLCECDITINPITRRAAQSIINKHADYAAAGLPVVSTQENEEYQQLVESYQMGFNCKNNDSYDLADKIKLLSLDKITREEKGKNARKCAEELFDRKTTYNRIVELFI